MKARILALSLLAAGMTFAPVAANSVYAADKKGSFRSSGNYKVKGTAKVSSNGTITLSGFSTTSGPDLYVYVGNGSPTKIVAKLKRNSGSQSYRIPASLAKSITTVHIHCKRYGSLFGTARVK